MRLRAVHKYYLVSVGSFIAIMAVVTWSQLDGPHWIGWLVVPMMLFWALWATLFVRRHRRR